MKISRLVVAAVLMSGTACVTSQERPLPPAPPQPTVVDENARALDTGMVLDNKELGKVTAAATAGSAESALRLYGHYSSVGQARMAKYWLLYSAARGNPVAQYNLGFSLSHESDCESKVTALAWLRSAAQSGNKLAGIKAKENEAGAKPCLSQ